MTTQPTTNTSIATGKTAPDKPDETETEAGKTEQKNQAFDAMLGNVLRVAALAGVGLAVAVMAAIGLDREAQSRIIRNHPTPIAWALALAVLGLTLPVITLAVPETWKMATPSFHWTWNPLKLIAGAVTSIVYPLLQGESGRRIRIVAQLVGGIVFIGATVLLVRIGVAGVSVRESPTLKITVERPADSSVVHVTILADVPVLRSAERMSVRVAGVNPKDASEVDLSCKHMNSQVHAVPPRGTAIPFESRGMPGVGRVLYIAETGPSSTGKASLEATVNVEAADFTHVCAYAALTSRNDVNEDRAVWAFANLCAAPEPSAVQATAAAVATKAATAVPTASSSPTASPSAATTVTQGLQAGSPSPSPSPKPTVVVKC